jgi:hypothetical protein
LHDLAGFRLGHGGRQIKPQISRVEKFAPPPDARREAKVQRLTKWFQQTGNDSSLMKFLPRGLKPSS